MLTDGEPNNTRVQNDPFRNVPPRRRKNLDWITCEIPPDDLTPFEKFTREVDWENSFFGPISSWDEQLRSAVLICLADPEPAALLWGDKQHMIYNEAYTPLIGTIHPRLQGQEPRPAFGVLWDDYEANYRTCAATGGFVSNPGLLTMMTRFGYEEECYFSFKWAPFIGKDGNLTGVYASCSDTTHPIIASRRLDWLRSTGAAISTVGDFETLWSVIAQQVEKVPVDLPNFMIYSKLGQGVSPTRTSKLRLEACVGVQSRQHAAPRQIDLLEATTYANAMCTARAQRSIVVLREADGTLPQELASELDPRSFGDRSTEVAICPIFSDSDAVCYVVVGLSPKKRYNPRYESFLKSFAEDTIGSKLGYILLAHEKLRGRMLAQQAEDERNRRLEELEASETKYRQFADHAPLGMVRLDMKGDLIYCNAAWKDLFGYGDGDSQVRPWLKTMHPDDVERSVQFFEDVCSTREPVTFEHRLVRVRDGQSYPFWVLVTGFREDDEHVICWVTDISAQKAAANTLKEQMQEAILQRTRQENFIDMISHEIRNPLSAVLHCSEDIIRCANSIHSTGDVRDARSAAHEALESAQTISYCVEHQKRIVDDVLTLSKLDADLLEIALVPVEPRKAIRSALRIFDRELRESGIDLNVIEHASLDAMDVSLLMLDPNRFLQVLINLVTNSIKFTRTASRRQITVEITASTNRPTPENVRFFPTIRRDESPLSTRTGTPPPTPDREVLYLGISVCDTGRGLSHSESQSLFNRFAQASPKTHIEYGGSGLGLFISRQIVELMSGQIGIKHEQEAGCTFAFFVQTQRVTAEADELSKVADRLKISLTHHPVTPLTGSPASAKLDTPTALTPLERPSSALSAQLGGSITIEVEAGTSSADTTQPNTRKNSVVVPSTAAPATPQVSPTKILVVEDNLINQKVVCKQLRNRGYEVHAANHGGEALSALQAASRPGETYFDIILCDIEMPVMDGIACTREVRKLESEGLLPGHIPMIAVTANARSTHVERALEAGMDDVTTKPYRMDELVNQMGQVMEKMESPKLDAR